jgi:DNA modification methylase
VTATIIRGDARALPLPDASVDLIITSPPYFGLRSYTDGGEHYAGQIGAESTPAEYVAALLDCTAEWMRVLKPEGSLWVNLGDKYTNRTRGAWAGSSDGYTSRPATPRYVRPKGIPEKSLMGLPWRYALGCIDDLGLILRAEVIWSKPNGLPESVTDRVRRSHEQWFHFTQASRYFSAVDEIREAHEMRPQRRPNGHQQRQKLGVLPAQTYSTSARDEKGVDGHPLGKLPGSVWEVPTQPLRVPSGLEVDHFAAFPMEWPRRLILGWSPAGICTVCGEGRRPLAERAVAGAAPTRRIPGAGRDPLSRHGQADAGSTLRGQHRATITGYACACPTAAAPSRPAVVLDPFGGTGTAALLATVLGRNGISVDRSADYCRLAAWRTTDPGERARALGVPKPPPVLAGQGDLFDGEVSA